MTKTANVENVGSINNPPGGLWCLFPVYLYIAGMVIMSDHGNFPVN